MRKRENAMDTEEPNYGTPPAGAAREIRVFSMDKVPDEDDELYDFRPQPVGVDEVSPKELSVTPRADESESIPEKVEASPTPAPVASATSAKSQGKAAASASGSQPS